MTPRIVPHTVQWFVAYVDYVQHNKGDAKGTRRMVIRKLERKAADMAQPDADSRTKSWKELYDRRSNK
jgi:hypothetical protein